MWARRTQYGFPGPKPFWALALQTCGIFRAYQPIEIAPYPAGAWQRHMHRMTLCFFFFCPWRLFAEVGYCLAPFLLSGSACAFVFAGVFKAAILPGSATSCRAC